MEFSGPSARKHKTARVLEDALPLRLAKEIRQIVMIEHLQGFALHRVVIPGSGASSELVKQLTDLA